MDLKATKVLGSSDYLTCHLYFLISNMNSCVWLLIYSSLKDVINVSDTKLWKIKQCSFYSFYSWLCMICYAIKINSFWTRLFTFFFFMKESFQFCTIPFSIWLANGPHRIMSVMTASTPLHTWIWHFFLHILISLAGHEFENGN